MTTRSLWLASILMISIVAGQSIGVSNASAEEVGKIDYEVNGIDTTGKHFPISYGEGIVHYDTYLDENGIARANNTIVFVIGNTYGIAVSMFNSEPETTLDYCCWNASANIVEQSDGSYNIEMYASSDYPEFFQFASFYFRGTLADDERTITDISGTTTFETGDANNPPIRCDVRLVENCHPEVNVGDMFHTWQADFVSDTSKTSFINGALAGSRPDTGSFVLVQEGIAEVLEDNQHFTAGEHTVQVVVNVIFERDSKGKLIFTPYAGMLFVDKGLSTEYSVELTPNVMRLIEPDTLQYDISLGSPDSFGDPVFGWIFGKLKLNEPIDFEKRVNLGSKSGNTLLVEVWIFLPTGIEVNSLDTLKTSVGSITFQDGAEPADRLYCGKPLSYYNVINGSPDGDTLVGTADADLIRGFGGDDVIEGLGGNDCIRGGSGDDTLIGGDGNDSIRGGLGDDEIEGNDGSDRLSGGKGDDTIAGDAGADQLMDGNDNDQLDGGTDEDVCRDTSGDDELHNCELIV